MTVVWLALCSIVIPGPAAWADPGPSVVTNGAVSVQQTSATLTGTVYPSGSPTAVSFEYGTSTAYGGTATASGLANGNGSVRFNAVVTHLTPGTTYHYRAVATNVSNPSSSTVYGADATFVTTAAKPPTVATGGAIDVRQTSATLTGTARPSGSATRVNFVYGTGTAYGTSTGTIRIGSGNRSVGFDAVLTGLAPGTTYHYRAVATNSSGSTRGFDLTFTTTNPPVTTTGHANVAKGTSATLTGTVDPSGSATTVTFEYGDSTAYSNNTPAQAVGSGYGPVGFHITITGLVTGTTYHFRAVATNQNGTTAGADHTFTERAATSTAAPTATISPSATDAPTAATVATGPVSSTSSGHGSLLIWLLSGLVGIAALGVIVAAVRLRPKPPGS